MKGELLIQILHINIYLKLLCQEAQIKFKILYLAIIQSRNLNYNKESIH
jgi:hypothetical protein